jgi:two-component system chemotaxis sensor kinase CheA
MESCHAVFFVKNLDQYNEPVFQLLASYAFKEKKHDSNTFRMGEGLVGQAVLEKSPIILTNVPPDYIRVKSGLGEAAPLTLYVLPVIFEGDVKAVLELASFKPFSVTRQTFLEEMINSLGIILDSVIGRIQLAKLLEESQVLMEEVQAQSEELQAQQEELRATNEELEEQAQALRQSEEKLQIQQEELEQTNTELEEKADHLEEQNKKYEFINRELERAREELEEKAQQLSLSSKYKSEFLANMSHELRTPLNSLLILSKLLSDNNDGNLSEKQVEFAKTIYSSGYDLLTLINDILDLTKIESGKMTVNPSKVLIHDFIEFIENSFRPIANDKNLRFNIVLKEPVPVFIYSDEQRIQQVLKNLLSNAFKFTDKGEVTLVIDLFSNTNDQSIFSFSVVDTGIGIPKEKQDLIFEAFQQADGTTSRKYGGTGLGLSICREICTLLGGNITVESKEGKGSKFTFYVGDYQKTEPHSNDLFIHNEVAAALDYKQNFEAKQKQPIETNNHIKRLLIVDDDLRQRNSLMELIGDKDVIIKAVSSGYEAMEQLKVNHYDCLILDLVLSDMTGFELLDKIKGNVEEQNLKVFIYTGRSLSSKEEIYLNKYAHTVIIKDEHSPQRLKEELDLYLNSSNGTREVIDYTEADQIKSIPGLEGKKVLLVDDDVRNVYALSSIMEPYGLEITFAENGKEGLELLEKYSDFDIVLMDIMMPEMDGYEAMQRLRAIPKFANLPVIALTAKAMKEDREKCMEAGASDYVIKPVDPDQLISLMRVWLYPQKGNL